MAVGRGPGAIVTRHSNSRRLAVSVSSADRDTPALPAADAPQKTLTPTQDPRLYPDKAPMTLRGLVLSRRSGGPLRHSRSEGGRGEVMDEDGGS